MSKKILMIEDWSQFKQLIEQLVKNDTQPLDKSIIGLVAAYELKGMTEFEAGVIKQFTGAKVIFPPQSKFKEHEKLKVFAVRKEGHEKDKT